MKNVVKVTTTKTKAINENSPTEKAIIRKDIFAKASELTSLEWTEILQNEKLTNALDLANFLKYLYSFQDHKAYASQIALILETTHPPLNPRNRTICKTYCGGLRHKFYDKKYRKI